MYKIIYTDLKNKTQKVIDSHNYQLDANELCKIAAEKLVIEKEGNKYLNKSIWKKNEIIKHGFYIIEGKTDFNKKYKIYQKSRNTLFYTGELIKIGYFQTIKFEEYNLITKPKKNRFDHQIQFDEVLRSLSTHINFLQQSEELN